MAKKSAKPIGIRRVREAKLFALWLSIPAIIKKMSVAQKKDLGFEEEDFLELTELKTRTAFGKKYKVTSQQLCRWEKREDLQEMARQFDLDSNVLKFTKDVNFSFTRKTIKEADASRVKLWKQIFEGWQETTENVNRFIIDDLRKIQDGVRGLIDQEKKNRGKKGGKKK